MDDDAHGMHWTRVRLPLGWNFVDQSRWINHYLQRSRDTRTQFDAIIAAQEWDALD